MDAIRREVEEKRDAEAEKAVEANIREIRDSVLQKSVEHDRHQQEMHLKHLKAIQTGQLDFVADVERMKEAEAKEHEERKAEVLRKAQLKLEEVSKKCDYVTQAALDNLEGATSKLELETRQLEKENSESKEKQVEVEVNLDQRIFGEVNEQKDKDESAAQERAEKFIEMNYDLQKEEQKMMSDEREERKNNAALNIIEIRNDLAEQQRMGQFNLAIQQSADDRKNRRQINAKIMEVKTYSQDMDQCYASAYIVLSASPELFKGLSISKKRPTKNRLTRFNEILDSINRKLGEIEQNLASLEMKDVEMGKITREIKTQISSFGRITAYFIMILSVEGVDIDEKKTEEFSKAKDTLFEQINAMQMISENRHVITQMIQDRQNAEKPVIAELAIEN